MSQFSENSALNREHSFYGGIVVLTHLVLGGAAFIILLYGISRYLDEGGSLGCFFWCAVGVGTLIYYCRSVQKGTGVFYALDLWEQSLIGRRSDDELIRAYKNGQRIFKNSIEAEVFDGCIVPKSHGSKLHLPDSHNK